jgi:hypothetical protein
MKLQGFLTFTSLDVRNDAYVTFAVENTFRKVLRRCFRNAIKSP